MKSRAELIKSIQGVNADDFNIVAMDVFRYQYEHNEVYQKYVDNLVGKTQVKNLTRPIFLPIQAFKQHKVVTGSWHEEKVFTSSGTSGSTTSKHYVRSVEHYLKSCSQGWQEQYGSLSDYAYLCLLPGYMERPGSSLIEMMKFFVGKSNFASGFYLNNHQDLYDALSFNNKEQVPTILFGVSFGLMDFIEDYAIDFPDLIIMETGGMKGRREELLKEELHAKIAKAFGVKQIHSEYGMTELFSQAYSKADGVFNPSHTLRISTTEIADPLTLQKEGKTGIINISDLSNIDTCSFIMTDDLGICYGDGSFKLMGRLDQSDIRGCNLMVV